jgi:acylpyruvate hydrolase
MKDLFNKVIHSKNNKIICIGKNYLDHVNEMGGKNTPSKPTVFTKPWSAIVEQPDSVKLPNWSKVKESLSEDTLKINKLLNITEQVYNYELELGLEIGKTVKNYDHNKQDYRDYISNYFLALDLTNRTLQKIGKDEFTGWFYGKEFDNCLPISQKIVFNKEVDLQDVVLQFNLNGELKQNCSTKNMIFSIPEIICFLTKYMTLEEGDLILTGTPSGIGPIKYGDIMEGKAIYDKNTLVEMKFNVEELI